MLCLMYSCISTVKTNSWLRRLNREGCECLLTISWSDDIGTAQAGSMFMPASKAATDQLSSKQPWTNRMTQGGSCVQRCLLETYVKGAFSKVQKCSVFLSVGFQICFSDYFSTLLIFFFQVSHIKWSSSLRSSWLILKFFVFVNNSVGSAFLIYIYK
jgi:hypothetical protein